MTFISLTFAFLAFAYACWLLRSYRWPRVQARVLKTWKEVTDVDEGSESGWLHAELEYWHESTAYRVSWRGDLHVASHLPPALWMAIHPDQPDAPQLLPGWTAPVVAGVIGACLLLVSMADFIRPA